MRIRYLVSERFGKEGWTGSERGGIGHLLVLVVFGYTQQIPRQAMKHHVVGNV